MKTKLFSKILGVGLAIGLVFALGAAFLPAGEAQADEMEWGEVTTPSWEDLVIEPGSDIFDYVAAGENGDIVYALGAIYGGHDDDTPCGDEGNAIGLSGSFEVDSGSTITITAISDDVGEIEGDFEGTACYLRGDFTWIMNDVFVGPPSFIGEAAVSGEIVVNDSGPDTMTFSGKIYRDAANPVHTDTIYDIEGTYTDSDDVMVYENGVDPINFGGLEIGFPDRSTLFTEPRAWMSDDGGVTWSDITETVQDANNLPGPFIQFFFGGVDAAPNDEDWLAIGGGIYLPPCDYDIYNYPFGTYPDYNGAPAVVASQDGAGEFTYTSDMRDNSAGTWMKRIYDVAVSPEDDDIHNVAVAGYANVGTNFDGADDIGTVYRLEAGTWLSASWEDTSDYDGWDSGIDANDGDEVSNNVLAVDFSTNYDLDQAVICMTVANADTSDGGPPIPYLQEGLWDSNKWNDEAAFSEAVKITNEGEELWALPGKRMMGFALPADFDAGDSSANNIYLYANAYNTVTESTGGNVFIAEDGSLSMRCGPSGEPLLASIDVYGDADTCKAMVGTYISWDQSSASPPGDFDDFADPWYADECVGEPLPWDCCEGVTVYHTVELDDCCPEWEAACKDPSGPYMAVVSYTPDGEKEYAVTSGTLDMVYHDFNDFIITTDDTLDPYPIGWGKIVLESPIQLQNLTSITYDVWAHRGYPPYVNIYLDENGDGVWDSGTDNWLIFEPYMWQKAMPGSSFPEVIESQDGTPQAARGSFAGDWYDDDWAGEADTWHTVTIDASSYVWHVGTAWNCNDLDVLSHYQAGAGIVYDYTACGGNPDPNTIFDGTEEILYIKVQNCSGGIASSPDGVNNISWVRDIIINGTDYDLASPQVSFGSVNTATAGWGDSPSYLNLWGFYDFSAGLSDESAFSMSRDDAVSFNQLGLIDTDIDILSDVAVCPLCDVIYLSSINVMENWDCERESMWQAAACDSIWRSFDNGDTWERIFHGDWSENVAGPDELLLRLPCDAIDDCCDHDDLSSPSGTIYMGIQGTEDLFYSRDCGQCWTAPPAQKITIQDFAVESENIVYVLNAAGEVSVSTQYGRHPADEVDTEVSSGWSITSCCDAGLVLVGGYGDEPVGYSSDGGETWDLTDDLINGDDDAEVHVACYDCDGTTTLFAAVSDNSSGGIYRTTIDSGEWTDMEAYDYDYDGIAIGRSDGTLYAVSDSISVKNGDACLCDRFVDPDKPYDYRYSGVARNLDPCSTDCCDAEVWDYLIAGLSHGAGREDFDMKLKALKICGCTTIDTNSVLWAIDNEPYQIDPDAADFPDGTLWSYEDCAAKKGPVLTAPADEAILDCDVCAECAGAPLTFKWERMCLACSYDIEIMDEDGNLIAGIYELDITGDPPELYWDGTITPGGCTDGSQTALRCGSTYTWHVREANTETDECVHSPWSETWTFTIEVSAFDSVYLIAPEVGAMGVPLSNVGFSWSSVPGATSYSFVLSPNADLSSALATSDQSGTAYAYSGTLDYEVSYYWQVTAWKDGIMLSQSNIGTFSTAPEEVIIEPPPPGEAPVINIPGTTQITPTYIYAIIGIGAGLAVVVIVLIVRTKNRQ